MQIIRQINQALGVAQENKMELSMFRCSCDDIPSVNCECDDFPTGLPNYGCGCDHDSFTNDPEDCGCDD